VNVQWSQRSLLYQQEGALTSLHSFYPCRTFAAHTKWSTSHTTSRIEYWIPTDNIKLCIWPSNLTKKYRRTYSNGAVQPILCSPKSRMCSPSCKIVQFKISKYVLWTFTQINNKSDSLICCICSGDRWELATCLSYKREGCTVSGNSVAGLQRLTQFPGIQVQRKPVTHLSISSIFGSEANTRLRLPRSAEASAAPVVDCWSSDRLWQNVSV